MRELIEKLRAATAPSNELDALATVALFGGEFCSLSGDSLLWMWRETQDSTIRFPLRLTQSLDDLNEAFEKALPGCGRSLTKGQTGNEAMFACAVTAKDSYAVGEEMDYLSAVEHDLEPYAYLIAVLEAVEAKRASEGVAA